MESLVKKHVRPKGPYTRSVKLVLTHFLFAPLKKSFRPHPKSLVNLLLRKNAYRQDMQVSYFSTGRYLRAQTILFLCKLSGSGVMPSLITYCATTQISKFLVSALGVLVLLTLRLEASQCSRPCFSYENLSYCHNCSYWSVNRVVACDGLVSLSGGWLAVYENSCAPC